LIGFIDLLDGDQFDVGGDVVLPTELEHLLGFPDPANQRASEREPVKFRRPKIRLPT
jgi:hypothetical protein